MGANLVLERDKLYRARNGSIWRVLAVDLPGSQCVAAAHISGSLPSMLGVSGLELFQISGKWENECGDKTDADLIAEYRKPREFWIMLDGLDIHHTPFPGTIHVREVLE